MKRRWTAQEEQLLWELWTFDLAVGEIARRLGRTPAAVNHRAVLRLRLSARAGRPRSRPCRRQRQPADGEREAGASERKCVDRRGILTPYRG